MLTKTEVTLINVKAKGYDFLGKDNKQIKGTSYKAILTDGDEIYEMKTDENVYKDVGKEVNKQGLAHIEISKQRFTGALQLRLTQFDYVE